MSTSPQPLSNVQLEILKAFSHNLSDSDLAEFKKVLAHFFAQRAIEGANKVWGEKGWGQKDVDKLLHTKLRSTQKK